MIICFFYGFIIKLKTFHQKFDTIDVDMQELFFMGLDNSGLKAANKGKNDEFYTQYDEI